MTLLWLVILAGGVGGIFGSRFSVYLSDRKNSIKAEQDLRYRLALYALKEYAETQWMDEA